MNDKFIAKCIECDHAWIVAYLPMDMEKFSKIAGQKWHCPKCAAGNPVMGNEGDLPNPDQELRERLALLEVYGENLVKCLNEYLTVRSDHLGSEAIGRNMNIAYEEFAKHLSGNVPI